MFGRPEQRRDAVAHSDPWPVRWLPFFLAAAVYAAVALHQITLSGVYMDEVNPDYLVVRLLNWTDPPIPAWVPPGTYLLDRFPVLTSLYHGTQTLWLGLPAFWLLGTSVTGLRVTHALFALGILAALYALLGRAGVGRWWAAAACAALAVEPAFVYAFRTQCYITTAPVAWLFLCLYALQRSASPGTEFRRRWLAASGVFHGLAFAGYFIYLFFAPAVAFAVVAWADAGDRVRPRLVRLVWWGVWFGVGTLPYIVGYALLVKSEGGLAGGWTYFVHTQAMVGGNAAPLSLGERFAVLSMLVGLVFSNEANHILIFSAPVPVVAAELKTTLLLAVPLLLGVIAELRKRSTPLLRILLAMQVSFAAGALYFGGRLWAHHYMPLVPLAYATLATALVAILAATPASRAPWLYAAPLALLFGLNVAGDADEARTLRETGGVGYYTDAINTFADDLRREHPKEFIFLPDWGLFMPVAFLTGGTVQLSTVEDFAEGRRQLCAGRDVSVALVSGDRTARLSAWRQQLGWGQPAIKEYRQRDGTVVFVLGTFYGGDASQRCAPDVETAPAAR